MRAAVRGQVTTAASLDFAGGSGLRHAVCVDDAPPQIVNINGGEPQATWNRRVAHNVNQRPTL
jgi:hypothetical protein